MVFLNSMKNPNGGRPTTEYHLSINMAKELSMVERNDGLSEALFRAFPYLTTPRFLIGPQKKCIQGKINSE